MEYKKLAKDEDCAFPEEKNCNENSCGERCIYMKYNRDKSIFDPTRWECTYKKEKEAKQ